MLASFDKCVIMFHRRRISNGAESCQTKLGKTEKAETSENIKINILIDLQNP